MLKCLIFFSETFLLDRVLSMRASVDVTQACLNVLKIYQVIAVYLFLFREPIPNIFSFISTPKAITFGMQ